MAVGRGVLRSVSTVAAAVTAVGLMAVPVAGVADAAPALSWGACPAVHHASADTQCASLQVPRDYAKPDGPTITILVSRIPAKNQSAKRGVLVGNPGGPGGGAIGLFGNIPLPQAIRDEWDLVGLQPRGLPGSTPVRCDPVTAKQARTSTGLGALTRDLCEKNTPGYTRTLTTENTARDIEQARKALGVDKLSLYGISYGTWLMSTYATLFPQHTDRLVLDSAMDPADAWGTLMHDQTAGYKARAHAMMTWIAANDATYHLGRTPLAVYQRWSALVEREAGVPPSFSAPPAKFGDVPPGLRTVARQYVDGVNLTADARARFENFIGTLANPAHVQAESPLLMLTRINAPNRNLWPQVAQAMTGTLKSPRYSKADMDAMAVSTNMQAVIMCNEDWSPKDPLLTPAALVQNGLLGDVFETAGLLFKSGLSCGGTTPVTQMVPISGNRLAVRPLQIQSVGDPQTPYRSSLATRRAMGAHLITVGGGDHGQIGRSNAPLDAAITEYLRTGRTAVTRAPQGPITAPLTAG